MKWLKLVIGVGLSSILSSSFFAFAVDTSKLGDTGTAPFPPMFQQRTSESFESETVSAKNENENNKILKVDAEFLF